MREQEEQYIKHEVKDVVMPDIIKMLGLVGYILRNFFPKIENKVVGHIMRIVEFILEWRKINKEEA